MLSGHKQSGYGAILQPLRSIRTGSSINQVDVDQCTIHIEIGNGLQFRKAAQGQSGKMPQILDHLLDMECDKRIILKTEDSELPR